MRVVHVIERLDSSYGGPAVSLPLFIKSLDKLSVESEIWSISNDGYVDNKLLHDFKLNFFIFRRTLSKYVSCALIFKMLTSCIKKDVDLFHFHSVWSSPTWFGMFFCRIFKVPYVLSPRSSLYSKSLQKKRVLKSLLSVLFLKRFISTCEFVHCTDKEEEIDVVRFCNCRTRVIPHGVDLPYRSHVGSSSSEAFNKIDFGRRNILYCSRIHPRKNLRVAIEAFASSGLAKMGWKFLVAGPVDDRAYFSSINRCIHDYSINESVTFLGMVVEPEKSLLYQYCDVFILLSDFENFGMSIAEALSFNTYVIISKNTPWSNLEQYGVGCSCGIEVSEVCDALLKYSEANSDVETVGAGDYEGYIKDNCILWDDVAMRFELEYRRIRES
ncbi:MAG: hypothetical protein COA68_09010 [Oceanobacter sp.]|nr:MAG: hypothetical protein COA68_09010 [Oceanobacter sp.]